MEYAIMRVEKIKSRADLGSRAAHNLRSHEKAAPHADRSLRDLNRTSGKTTIEGVQEALNRRLSEVPKHRKDAVLGLEIMCSASPEWFKIGNTKAQRQKRLNDWASTTQKWIYEEYGKENLLTISLHLDETTPHIQALMVPIINGRLCADHWMGGKRKLGQMQDRYAAKVAHMGLRRGETRLEDLKPALSEKGRDQLHPRHTSLKDFYALARRIMAKAQEPAPVVPKLPIRGILGNVSTEEWETLRTELEQHGKAAAKAHAEALAARIFIGSGASTEAKRRQEELAKREAAIAARERALKAEEERIKQRAATAERLVNEKRAELGQISDQVIDAQAEVAKLMAAIDARRDALKIGTLEDYRDHLAADIEALKADRAAWRDD